MFFGLSIFGVYTHRQHSSQNVSLLRVSATSYRLEVSMIPLQGAFRKYRRGFFFSARGRRFDLAVLNIVWLRVYVLDSPMRDWFNKAAWQKARDPPPQCLCECARGHGWLHMIDVFYCLFSWNLLHKERALIITLLHEGFLPLVYIWKKEWPWLRRQPPRLISGLVCALCAGHSVRSSKRPQIVRGASRGAQWNQLSISHFPLFVFSVPHGPSICSDIDPSISDCPALVRTAVKCGGVQRAAQRDCPSVG